MALEISYQKHSNALFAEILQYIRPRVYKTFFMLNSTDEV